MKRTILVALAVALTMAAWQVVAATASDTHEAKPFEGTSQGTQTVGPTGASSGTGTVQALHLGSGTYTINSTQDFARHVEGEHGPGNNCAFIDGTITLTAADGDQLEGDIDNDRSVSCVSQETPGPGPDAEYLTTLYVNVTGGTGRFADATGYYFSRVTSTLTGGSMTGANFDDVAVLFGDIDY